MPEAVVTNTTAIVRSPRVMQVEGMFDVAPTGESTRTWQAKLPTEERDWSVGLIVGPSGAGKSTVARAIFGQDLVTGYDWPADRSILDAFPRSLSVRDVVGALTSVGFGSPPSWLRPFVALSTGEQFRVTAARALAEARAEGRELVVLDEFTSVVDRQVAQVASHGIQKAARASNTRLVAVTCHYDVLDWLNPDWVYQPHLESFAWRELQPRPKLGLTIAPVDRAAWSLFSPHHYLSSKLMHSAACFGAWADAPGGPRLIGFLSYMHFPHARVRDIKMAHRYVVLPEYQGLGIGSALAEWTGEYLAGLGYRFRFVTVHPSIVGHFNRSPRWRLCAQPSANPGKRNLKSGASKSMSWDVAKSRRLMTYSFEYVPLATNAPPGARLAPRAQTPQLVTLGRR
jgi:ABC-type lipoprotein export system ATPase subunit/GNAT superfamily N-acetyltransferase